MNVLDVRRFALAFGVTGTVLYAGCISVMAVAPKEATIRFFNSLMHGVDVEPIIRWEMPLWEVALGIAGTFILAWLTGGTIAAIYNFGRSD